MKRLLLIAFVVVAACSGSSSTHSAPLSIDTAPPSVPANVTVTPTSPTTATLTWSPSVDAVGVAGYEVFRDGTLLATTTRTDVSDTALAPATRHCWSAKAFDAAGNRSGMSVEACATMPVMPDATGPAVVALAPAPGTTDLPATTVFTARFDEAIDPSTLTSGFTLHDAHGAPVAAQVSWDAASLTATLTPSLPLEPLGTFAAEVSTAVTDLAGNHLIAAQHWSVGIRVKELVLRVAPASSLGARIGSSAIAVADFDLDGHPDLAVTEWGAQVWIARGDGAGAFAPAVAFPAGSSTTAIAAADLDGDGYPDLAVADLGSNPYVASYLQVLRNRGTAGPGTFAAPVPLQTGAYTIGVTAADLDGNGWVDLVSADCLGNRLSVFLATGDGAFAPAVAYAANDPAAVVTALLRPGTTLDLVTTDGPLLLGDGRGAFSDGPGPYDPGPYPMDVAAADLDRDGHVDLVIANDGTDRVTVLLGDGSGGFASGVTWQTGAYPRSVRIADLNGDGWPDLIVSRSMNGGVGANALVVLLGLGGGAFGPPITIRDFGNGGFAAAVADLNGDGKPDLATVGPLTFTSTLVEVWLNATQ